MFSVENASLDKRKEGYAKYARQDWTGLIVFVGLFFISFLFSFLFYFVQ